MSDKTVREAGDKLLKEGWDGQKWTHTPIDEVFNSAGEVIEAPTGDKLLSNAFEESFNEVFGPQEHGDSGKPKHDTLFEGEPLLHGAKLPYSAAALVNTGTAGFKAGLHGISSTLTEVQAAGLKIDARAVSSVLSTIEDLKGLDAEQYMGHITEVVYEAKQFMQLLVTVRAYMDHPVVLDANKANRDSIEESIEDLYKLFKFKAGARAQTFKRTHTTDKERKEFREAQKAPAATATRDDRHLVSEPDASVKHFNDRVEPLSIKPYPIDDLNELSKPMLDHKGR